MNKLLVFLLILSLSVRGQDVNISMDHSLRLSPVTGDNYPQLQWAVNYCSQFGLKLYLNVGNYPISHTVVVANRVGADYGQVTIEIIGAHFAKNTPQNLCSNIMPTFGNAPALVLQQCKGCRIQDLSFVGIYQPPSSPLQIDTLSWSGWDTPLCTSEPTNPYAAIAIDPFSDPKYYTDSTLPYPWYSPLSSYYLPGMNENGSTAVMLEGLGINNFVVGLVITPSMQANGEEISLVNSRIDRCKVAYAYTQAQSKANSVINFQSWGAVHTVFDGVNFGFPRGDGSTAPFIDMCNIAGYTHQLIDMTANSFPISISRVYGEGIYKVGFVNSGVAGVHFNDWQVDFQGGYAGLPSPDFYYYGPTTSWVSCMLRIYGGDFPRRFVLNCSYNSFSSCVFGSLPVLATLNPSQGPALLSNCSTYWDNQQNLFDNTYDSVTLLTTVGIAIDRTSFTGYFIAQFDHLPAIGAFLTTPGTFSDYDYLGSSVTPLGYVTAIKGSTTLPTMDTVFLSSMGQNIHNGELHDVYNCLLHAK